MKKHIISRVINVEEQRWTWLPKTSKSKDKIWSNKSFGAGKKRN